MALSDMPPRLTDHAPYGPGSCVFPTDAEPPQRICDRLGGEGFVNEKPIRAMRVRGP